MPAIREDLRFYPRKELNTDVLYKIEGEADFTAHHSINIGPGGVLLETKTPLKEGTTLELCFSLPNSQQLIKAEGRVVWINHQTKKRESPSKASVYHLVGVEFTSMGEDAKRIIEEFLR
ncbi:MAG: PilZ domain-containing protein [Deltaproteobacteria bacterium]|nr:PilZ domain-containing protein [Deltaproteobacteria bacterium]